MVYEFKIKILKLKKQKQKFSREHGIYPTTVSIVVRRGTLAAWPWAVQCGLGASPKSTMDSYFLCFPPNLDVLLMRDSRLGICDQILTRLGYKVVWLRPRSFTLSKIWSRGEFLKMQEGYWLEKQILGLFSESARFTNWFYLMNCSNSSVTKGDFCPRTKMSLFRTKTSHKETLPV